ncbi:hypothetical protein [Deinococcus cellulosilyticus]|uniref:hypothetical protein n=2 Tax=Deinococcus cellulosilyticus TaxID=401558 RepID=UPI00360761AF
MKEHILKELTEIIRETFEGGLPGQGTQYLDHNSGIYPTMDSLTAQQASYSWNGIPSIASHIRHMKFHLNVVVEWMQGQQHKRDWLASFKPYEVTEEEWQQLKTDFEETRRAFFEQVSKLSEEEVLEDMGHGTVAHLAYHLGAIRQLMHLVPKEVQDV